MPHDAMASLHLVGEPLFAELLDVDDLVQVRVGSNSLGDEGVLALLTGLRRNRGSLTSLAVVDNAIGARGAAYLQRVVAACPALTALDLSGNPLGDDGAFPVAAALRRHRALRSLTLWGVALGDDGAEALADALYDNTLLETLDLWNNPAIGGAAQGQSQGQGAASLCRALATNVALTALSLRGCAVGNAGAEALSAALAAPSSALRAADLRECAIDDDGAGLLAVALSDNATLTELQLGGNRIADRGAGLFADALKHNGSLLTLALPHNRVGPIGAKLLGAALRSNGRLQALPLWSNPLGDGGVGALCEALVASRCCALVRLELWECGLGVRGCLALGSLLLGSLRLRALSLRFNPLAGDAGAACLARGMSTALNFNRNPCVLEELDLCCNGLTDAGAALLGAALPRALRLRRLRVWEPLVGDAGATALGNGAHECAAIEELAVFSPKMTGAARQRQQMQGEEEGEEEQQEEDGGGWGGCDEQQRGEHAYAAAVPWEEGEIHPAGEGGSDDYARDAARGPPGASGSFSDGGGGAPTPPAGAADTAPPDAIGGEAGKGEGEGGDEEEPIMAGALLKKGGGKGTFGRRNWKSRFFTLACDPDGAGVMRYFAAADCKKLLGEIDLGSIDGLAASVEGAKHAFHFQLTSAGPDGRSWQLRADSQQEVDGWLATINELVTSSNMQQQQQQQQQQGQEQEQEQGQDTDIPASRRVKRTMTESQ